jgi:hypothetical protein
LVCTYIPNLFDILPGNRIFCKRLIDHLKKVYSMKLKKMQTLYNFVFLNANKHLF